MPASQPGRRGVAAARPATGVASRGGRCPNFRAQPEIALGLLLATRNHLPQRAVDSDAGVCARLRHPARTGPSAGDEPFAEILAGSGQALPGLFPGERLVEAECAAVALSPKIARG